MSGVMRIHIDQTGAFDKGLNELQRSQLPYATRQAINATAYDVHARWKQIMPSIFDRPVPLTLKAVAYDKATASRSHADIYIRDFVAKGTAPARYLEAQVMGGARRHKGIERQLSTAGILPTGDFVVPGLGAKLDRYGNIPRSQLNSIKAQLGAMGDALSNESDTSRTRRLKRNKKQGRRDGNYFAVKSRTGKLPPGIYERIVTGFGSGVRSILHFVKSVRYRRRYPIFDIAEKIYTRRFPENFRQQLARAVDSSFRRTFK